MIRSLQQAKHIIIMVQGLAFLSKKSWHTKNLANQEKVWIAEERKKNEERKTHELARQIQAEREQEELDKITNQNGKQKRLDRGIDWMYSGQNPQSDVAQRDAEKQAEEYLLGKEFTGCHGSHSRPSGDLAQADQDNEGFRKVLAGKAAQATAADLATNESTVFLAESSVAERNEAFRLRHEDPMFAVSMAAAEKKRASERTKELIERVTGAVVEVDQRLKEDEEKISRSKERKSHKGKKKKSKKKHSKKRHHRPVHDYESETSHDEADSKSCDSDRKNRDRFYREEDRRTHRDDDRRHHHHSQIDHNAKRNRRSESPRDDRKRKKYDDDGSYPYREDIHSSQNAREWKRDYAARSELKPTNDYHRKKRHNESAKGEQEGERAFSQASSQSRGDYGDRGMKASGRKDRDDYDIDIGNDIQDDRKQPAQDTSRRQNSPSSSRRSMPQRHQDDNRSNHEPKYLSCKLYPPTNELKKPPGYGLQGQTRNSMEPSHSDNMLGPHQDVLHRRRKEKENERRRLRESASTRRPMTARERDEALQQMKYNAHLREQDTANRQLRPNDDNEDGERSRTMGNFHAPASFLQEVAQKTHGVHGDTVSMAQRISQNRNKQQRRSHEAFL